LDDLGFGTGDSTEKGASTPVFLASEPSLEKVQFGAVSVIRALSAYKHFMDSRHRSLESSGTTKKRLTAPGRMQTKPTSSFGKSANLTSKFLFRAKINQNMYNFFLLITVFSLLSFLLLLLLLRRPTKVHR
jgi:hypothetical protein